MYPSTQLLKEVFLVKFASALGVGPYYHRVYGYDILVMRDHQEFSMEKCDLPHFGNKQSRE